jgi:hypothetical protein
VVYQELARFGFLLLVVAISVSDLGQWLWVWSSRGAALMFTLLR